MIQPASSATDEDIAFARMVIEEAFVPHLESKLEKLNQFLGEKRGIRAGIEITWYFDKVRKGN